MSKDKRILLSCGIYTLSCLAIAVQFVRSFFGITPFERIGWAAVASILIYVGSVVQIKHKDRESTQEIMRRTFFSLLVIFSLLFFALVFVDSYFGDSRTYGAQRTLNLIPFKSFSLWYATFKGWTPIRKPIINMVGNFVICMPFALFLPLLFRKQRKYLGFVLTIFVLVLVVEAAQYVTARGVCDIDDLIFNVSGAAVAFAVLHTKRIRGIVKKLTKLKY